MVNRFPFILLIVVMLGLTPGVHGEAVQSEESIRKAAEQFVLAQLPEDQPGRPSIEIGHLDPRLRLPACDRSLEAFLPPGGKIIGGTTVGVRCPGNRPWSLYVPVKVALRVQVLVATRPLSRGTRLSADDVRPEERDVSMLTQGYLTDPQQAYGLVLKRSIASGAPVVPSALEAPRAIRRGEKVTVVGRSPSGIEVRMAGTALMDGAAGERIRVRNLSSNRIVEGTVAGAGIIEINL